MMAEDGGLGVMHPAMALMSVSLVGGMVSVIISPAALSTHVGARSACQVLASARGAHQGQAESSTCLAPATREGWPL